MTEHTTQESLTVGQVARRFDVTVRTLHHYDEAGLVRPSGRTRAGYRLYLPSDLERLQHVVVYRRLGFGLEEIKLLLADPASAQERLRHQRAAVMSRMAQLGDLVQAIDRALEKEATGMKLTPEEQRELFGEGFRDEYATEAQERWGDTDAWRQSRQRTSRYTKDDWAAVKAEADALTEAFVAAMAAGQPPTGTAAMDAAEAHRQHLTTRFYDVTPAFHRNLADLYVTDPRFTRTYEDLASGLAQYVRDAVHANADRAEAAG